MRLSSILISLLFGIVIITGFLSYFGSISTNYNVEGHNSSEFSVITNTGEQMEQIALEVQNKTEAVKANNVIPDVLGVIYVAGIGGVKAAATSVDSFILITSESADLLPLGTIGDILVITIISSIIFVIFIAIVLYYIRGGTDRL